MNVAYAFVTDHRQMELALHSAASLVVSQPLQCDIFIFCHRQIGATASTFSDVIKSLGSNVVFQVIEDRDLESHRVHGHVTSPTLLKLLAVERLMRDYDVVVYLDNDLLIFDDLQIGSLSLGGMPLGAVMDLDPSENGAFRHIDWELPNSRSALLPQYFNAGFMVFDAHQWDEGFAAVYSEALQEHDRRCWYKVDCTSIDQCALNKVFEGRWMRLPETYNMQTAARYTSPWNTARVRHYAGPRKFLPVSPFRNDGRDTDHIDRIRQAMGLPRIRFKPVYRTLFWANMIRQQYRKRAVKNFLMAAGCPV